MEKFRRWKALFAGLNTATYVPLCLIGRASLWMEEWEIVRVCLVGGLGDEVRRRRTIDVSVCTVLGSKAVWGKRMAGLLLYECDNRFA